MTPLALSGTAKSVSGATVHGRHLLRLRDANSGPVCEADAAIIRDDTDLILHASAASAPRLYSTRARTAISLASTRWFVWLAGLAIWLPGM